MQGTPQAPQQQQQQQQQPIPPHLRRGLNGGPVTRVLHVTNVPAGTTQADLTLLLKPYGELKASLILEQQNRGFIELGSVEQVCFLMDCQRGGAVFDVRGFKLQFMYSHREKVVPPSNVVGRCFLCGSDQHRQSTCPQQQQQQQQQGQQQQQQLQGNRVGGAVGEVPRGPLTTTVVVPGTTMSVRVPVVKPQQPSPVAQSAGKPMSPMVRQAAIKVEPPAATAVPLSVQQRLAVVSGQLKERDVTVERLRGELSARDRRIEALEGQVRELNTQLKAAGEALSNVQQQQAATDAGDEASSLSHPKKRRRMASSAAPSGNTLKSRLMHRHMSTGSTAADDNDSDSDSDNDVSSSDEEAQELKRSEFVRDWIAALNELKDAMPKRLADKLPPASGGALAEASSGRGGGRRSSLGNTRRAAGSKNENEIYGEVEPHFFDQIMSDVSLGKGDVFWDIGSGIGNLAFQAVARVGCQAHAIEIRQDLHEMALSCRKTFDGMVKHGRFPAGRDATSARRITFTNADATDEEQALPYDATVIFINNWRFTPATQHKLLNKFRCSLADGTRVVTLKQLFPRHRSDSRRRSPYADIFEFPFKTLQSPIEPVSWDARAIKYYVYTVSRAQKADDDDDDGGGGKKKRAAQPRRKKAAAATTAAAKRKAASAAKAKTTRRNGTDKSTTSRRRRKESESSSDSSSSSSSSSSSDDSDSESSSSSSSDNSSSSKRRRRRTSKSSKSSKSRRDVKRRR
jgi:Histone methylation protein DOT1